MKISKLVAGLLAASVFLPAAFVLGQTDQAEGTGMGPMGPPEQLKEIAFMVGDWDLDVKTRMTPEAEWSESKATATVESVLMGAALLMNWRGTFMGMPYEGLLTLTYDRQDGAFESAWIDNMAARASHMSGQIADKILVMQGSDTHQGMRYDMRMTTARKGSKEWTQVMETSSDGGETWFSSMEMVYNRKSL